MKLKVNYTKTVEYAIVPTRSYDDASLDLASPISLILLPGDVVKLNTGIALEIPSGYEVQVRSRSAWAYNGLIVLNSPATIDHGYRGPIYIVLKNIGNYRTSIKRGSRIAQMLLVPVMHMELNFKDTLDPSERGTRGFGSTGR